VATNAGGTGDGADHSFATLPEPPGVETAAASAVSQAQATLNASVNPNGASVSDCHFEYGTTPVYEASVPCSALPGSGSSAVAVSAQVLGLVANTTYHFRIVATNAGGTGDGADHSFATLPEPPGVTALSPTTGPAGGGTTVSISGTNLGGATSVRFGASEASSFAVNTTTSITAVSPAESAGAVDVTVTTPGGTSALAASDHFKFTPTVVAVSPASGPVSGGTAVVVTGTGFVTGTGPTTFRFGATFAKSVSCSSQTSCTAVAPAHEAGTVDVKATVKKLSSPKNRPADEFTYF
jgi:IPT/TIG domain